IIKRPLAADTEYHQVGEFQTPHHGAYGIALDVKAKVIASCGADRAVCVWGLDGAQKYRFEGAEGGLKDVVFAADGTMILAGGEDGKIHAWLIPQKTLGKSQALRHAALAGHKASILSLAVSRSGKFLLSGSLDA